MILGWSPFKIVSVSAVLYPRWPPLLKIEISSNGQNCSILSQKVPKFELYKHNDELFNIYYRIIYELWTFAYFDRLCKLEKRGDEIRKNRLLWNHWANLNQTMLKWSLGGPLSKLCPSAPSCIQDGRQLKIEISSNGQNCQKVPKFELYKHNDELFNIYYRIIYELWTFAYFQILSQKVPKFELYKHNDELFNIYYRIFYELWTFAYFDRLCKLEKRGDEIRKRSSPLKPLSQSQPNYAEMILGWSPFKIVSVSAVLYPRWPPWLKIEISSNGQNCSILSQKVPKFELYKHDELFNIYYRIFYELWTFAYFDWLCKLEKRGDEIKKILLLWKYWANLN